MCYSGQNSDDLYVNFEISDKNLLLPFIQKKIASPKNRIVE